MKPWSKVLAGLTTLCVLASLVWGAIIISEADHRDSVEARELREALEPILEHMDEFITNQEAGAETESAIVVALGCILSLAFIEEDAAPPIGSPELIDYCQLTTEHLDELRIPHPTSP